MGTVLGVSDALTVGFSAAKQRVLEMSAPLLGIFPMMGMQKCPELQKTRLERVQLLFCPGVGLIGFLPMELINEESGTSISRTGL